ncbi:MAG: redoxin family protein [Thermoanaerobaculia bacterium]
MKIRTPLLLLCLFVAGSASASAAVPEPTPTPASSPEVETLRLAADGLVQKRDFGEAIKQYKKANKLAGGRCTLCLLGLGKSFSALGAHRDAAESAEAALRLTEDPELQAIGWNQLALSRFSLAGTDAEKLRLAESSFRRVLTLVPDAMTHFNLGVTLVRLGRDEEGFAELRIFIEKAPDTAKSKIAEDILENPRRARESMLPSLELVTLDGDYVTNEDFAGKVVLFDFWGTWCAPCRDSIPSLRALVARSKGLPLVVVSVANDPDEATLRKFISEHGMTWPQVWDQKRSFVREMGVDSYPTYIVADHEGAILFRYSGWGDTVERAIQNEIRRAVAGAKRASGPGAP